MIRSKSSLFLAAILFSLCSLIFFYQQIPNDIPLEIGFDQFMSVDPNSSSFVCHIPHLNPFDPSIIRYFSKPNPLICERKQEQLVKEFTNGTLIFDEEKLRGVECWIIPFDHNANISDFTVRYERKEMAETKKKFNASHEFFEINCLNSSNHSVYSNFYAQIKKRTKTRNYKDSESIPIEESSPEHPAVVLIGFDTVSTSNFIRQMSKSHRLMKEMGFVDMRGQVKIHDNTYGNTVGLLTGLRAVETTEFTADLPHYKDLNYDDVEMVWRNFSKNGYVTFWGEDNPEIGTFSYKKRQSGFKKTPTDHYMRPFWLALTESSLFQNSSEYCFDSKELYKTHFSHLKRFIETYSGKRHFSFLWTQDISRASLNEVGVMDEFFENFLLGLQPNLNDTIVAVLSDHGLRYGDILETVVGRMESRMPFFSIFLPKSIREKYPHLENRLKSHKNHLTTVFDLHVTLNEIAHGRFLKKSKNPHKHGISLFHRIPKNRSCFDAGVPSDYCPCFVEKKIPSSEAKEATRILLRRLNEILRHAPIEERKMGNTKKFSCLPLIVNDVIYSAIRVLPEKLVKDVSLLAPKAGVRMQYRVVFSAKSPSNAVIGGIVERDFHSGKWSVSSEFERNNKYGNSSSCVIDPGLQKICHCI